MVKDGQYHGEIPIEYCKSKQDVLKLLPNLNVDDIDFFTNAIYKPKFTILVKRKVFK